ncbi:MAG: hypothetical protein NC253_07440 [Ruminococcus sp.]|nr:hypothetical protein [Ruminococcus sp.]
MFELNFSKISVAFDFSFFAAVALLTLLSGNFALLGLAACLWHELGHLFFMKICGVPVKRMVFYGAGIKIVPDKLIDFTGFRTSFLILIGGSGANLALAAVLYNAEIPAVRLFAAINGLIGAFNLLPLQYLDGGKLILLLIRRLCSYSAACLLERFFKWCGAFLILTVLIVFAVLGKGNITLYVTLCYLLVTSICAE